MTNVIRIISCSAALVGALLFAGPVFAAEKSAMDTASAHKASDKDGHDHGDHKDKSGHHDHADHEKEAKSTGKTSILEISVALKENLACLDKEITSTNHDAFHACLETIEALGLDLIALKGPADPTKKKRVNGYAKNLGMMAHKVDEYLDAKQLEKAKSQLKKLSTQVGLIESQFDELAKKNPVK